MLFGLFRRKKRKLTPAEENWNRLWEIWANGEIESPFNELMNYHGEVNNGGHSQYFTNTENAGDLEKEMAALYEILPDGLKENLQSAYRAYLLLERDEDIENAESVLQKCDKVFFDSENEINKLLENRCKSVCSEVDFDVTQIEEILYDKVKSEILKWNEEDVYAVSFFVYSNEAFHYKNRDNVSMWSISCNTEADCRGADMYAEERWNYAFWRQKETPIIDIDVPNRYTDLLYEWYESNGITDIGEENEDEMYDENNYYIGKGPVGHYELLSLASGVARRLQTEGVIKEHFGKAIPVIVHGLEYAWYDIEATKNANPGGEADVFIEAVTRLGMI